jgi:hypothetical protein
LVIRKIVIKGAEMGGFCLENNSKPDLTVKNPLKIENFILKSYNFSPADAVNNIVCTFYAP